MRFIYRVNSSSLASRIDHNLLSCCNGLLLLLLLLLLGGHSRLRRSRSVVIVSVEAERAEPSEVTSIVQRSEDESERAREIKQEMKKDGGGGDRNRLET